MPEFHVVTMDDKEDEITPATSNGWP